MKPLSSLPLISSPWQVLKKQNRSSSEQIIFALNRPLQKSLERLQARQYISIYQDDASHNKALLQLAKLDFNFLQCLHKRWDINFMDQLPECMQLLLQTLFNVYQEFEEELGEKEKYQVHYAKEAIKNLARAYFDEAKWLAQGYTPTMEEYMHVALVSGGYPMLTVTCLLGMGDIVTEDIFKWAFNDPNIVRASAIIARFRNDIVSYKVYIDEKARPPLTLFFG